MGDGESSDSERKLSKYNSAMAQQMRLDFLWQRCNELSCAGNLQSWNWKLDALWRELSADATPEEAVTIDDINERYIKVIKDKGKMYQILIQKEIALRKIQNNQGKGTNYADSEEDMM